MSCMKFIEPSPKFYLNMRIICVGFCKFCIASSWCMHMLRIHVCLYGSDTEDQPCLFSLSSSSTIPFLAPLESISGRQSPSGRQRIVWHGWTWSCAPSQSASWVVHLSQAQTNTSACWGSLSTRYLRSNIKSSKSTHQSMSFPKHDMFTEEQFHSSKTDQFSPGGWFLRHSSFWHLF